VAAPARLIRRPAGRPTMNPRSLLNIALALAVIAIADVYYLRPQ